MTGANGILAAFTRHPSILQWNGVISLQFRLFLAIENGHQPTAVVFSSFWPHLVCHMAESRRPTLSGSQNIANRNQLKNSKAAPIAPPSSAFVVASTVTKALLSNPIAFC